MLCAALADQRDMARYERDLSVAEMHNKAVKNVVHESQPPAEPLRSRYSSIATDVGLTGSYSSEREMKPLLERTRSLAGKIPNQGSIRPPCMRQGHQSAADEYVTLLGPPDISCADIPEEQLSRTYSRSCIWDPQTNPVPPIQEMEGFGRFRRSVHADANWELTKFRGDLQQLGPAAIHHLGDFEIARLKSGVMNNIRVPSSTSLASRSDSEGSSTGPRICWGFTPSRTSLATKSSKDRSNPMSHNGSVVTSPDRNGGRSRQLQSHSKRTSFLRLDPSPVPLAKIDETVDVQGKRIVPLIFNTQGTADEVIDDDEYESCEESFVSADVTAEAVSQATTTVAPGWHDKKLQIPQIVLPTRNRGSRHLRTFDHAPEKTRVGQKKPAKPVTRRLSSRGGKGLANRVMSRESVARAVERHQPANSKTPTSATDSVPPLAVFSPKALLTSSDESVEEIPADVGLFMTNTKASTPASNENNDVACCSNSIGWDVIAGVPPRSRLSTAQGRKRSNTAVRVHSGNIPNVYLDGDRKQLLDIEDVDRKPLQPVAV